MFSLLALAAPPSVRSRCHFSATHGHPDPCDSSRGRKAEGSAFSLSRRHSRRSLDSCRGRALARPATRCRSPYLLSHVNHFLGKRVLLILSKRPGLLEVIVV